MESKIDLNPSTIEAIQDLIQANLDSAKGFDECAKKVNQADLATLFSGLGTERARNASELQYYVVLNGERAKVDGTFLGALHLAWVEIRATLNRGNPAALLAEAERGEAHIKNAYESALRETAGSALNDVLLKQYAEVKQGYERICTLRK